MSVLRPGVSGQEDPIEGLLHAKLLTHVGEPGSPSSRQALAYAADFLSMGSELFVEQGVSVRLRLALMLAPREALTHKATDRTSRFEKVRRFIEEEYGYSSDITRALALAVTRAIESWSIARVDVAKHREALATRDGNLCKNCRVGFSHPPGEALSVTTADSYKPTTLDPERWISPSVDHAEPISRFGTNEIDNLELLCRFCNSGKEDASGPLPKHEFEFGAQLPYATMEQYQAKGSGIAYLRKVVYMTIARGRGTCSEPGCKNDGELTVRPVVPTGLFVLGNLRPVCYGHS